MHKRQIFLGLALGAGALIAIGAILTRLPDFDLEMTRDVPSVSKTETLASFVRDPAQWPKWFHLTTEAQALSADTIRLTVDPQKGWWRKFTLDVRVLANQPVPPAGQKLSLEFLEDSKQKLRNMFSDLRWEIDVLDAPEVARGGTSDHPSLVRGVVHARTASWRARLFGRLSPRVLLNQALYPDLIGLAEIETGKPEPALRMTP